MTTPVHKPEPMTYQQAGVDIDAGNALVDRIKPLAKATRRSGTESSIGGFGAVFDLKATGFKDPLLISTTDGVGTKLKLAIDTGMFSTIGIDLVAMCVNDLIVQGAEPLFFLDYYACAQLRVEEAASVISGIAEGCRIAGCALSGGETAEMPGMYAKDDFDLAGFSVGAVERDALLPKPGVQEGDILLGLSSSGFHSNGYSLVRKVAALRHALKDATPFTSEAKTLGEALLTPTRIYVKPLLETLKKTSGIKALAHITGGGITENLPRVLPAACGAEITLGSWPVLPCFQWVKTEGNIAEQEMLRTFNCGIGMVIVVEADKVAEVTALLKEQGEQAYAIGHITTRGTEAVTYQGAWPA